MMIFANAINAEKSPKATAPHIEYMPSPFLRLRAAEPTLSDRSRIVREKWECPPKLKSARVQSHLRRCLVEIQAVEIQAGMSGRDATATVDIVSIEWHTLDLYTIALDMAEDESLRVLVTQARSMIAAELIKRSTNPE